MGKDGKCAFIVLACTKSLLKCTTQTKLGLNGIYCLDSVTNEYDFLKWFPMDYMRYCI